MHVHNVLSDAKPQLSRRERASESPPFPTPTAGARRAAHAEHPLVTLKVTTPEDATAAGFTLKASLTTCLAETLRIQTWAQRFPNPFEYALRVAKERRIIRRSEELTGALEELYARADRTRTTAAVGPSRRGSG